MKEFLELSKKQQELIEEAFTVGNVQIININKVIESLVVIEDKPNVIVRFDFSDSGLLSAMIKTSKRVQRLSKLAGVAKCSPDDIFDLKKGIKIARLKFLRKVLILCREFFIEDTIKNNKEMIRTGLKLALGIEKLDDLIEKFRATIQ
jgi:hypothetical protein